MRNEHDVRRWRFIASALALLSWTPMAWTQTASVDAQPETGRQWLARCGAVAKGEPVPARQDFDAGQCLGWVEGLVDINEIYRGLGALEKTPEGFCMTSTATIEQAADVVTTYLEDHRSALDFSARILAYMALRRAFPCGPRSSPDVSEGPTISIP